MNSISNSRSSSSAPIAAQSVVYNNTTSGLQATNVQDAIDEVAQGGGRYTEISHPVTAAAITSAWKSIYVSDTITVDITSLGLSQAPVIKSLTYTPSDGYGAVIPTLSGAPTATAINIQLQRAASVASVSGVITILI